MLSLINSAVVAAASGGGGGGGGDPVTFGVSHGDYTVNDTTSYATKGGVYEASEDVLVTAVVGGGSQSGINLRCIIAEIDGSNVITSILGDVEIVTDGSAGDPELFDFSGLSGGGAALETGKQYIICFTRKGTVGESNNFYTRRITRADFLTYYADPNGYLTPVDNKRVRTGVEPGVGLNIVSGSTTFYNGEITYVA